MDLHEMKLKVSSSFTKISFQALTNLVWWWLPYCPLQTWTTAIIKDRSCVLLHCATVSVCRADSDGDTSVRKGLAGWGILLLPPWVLPPTFDFSHCISILDMHFSYRPLQWEKVIFIIGALCYECDWGSQRENPWQDKHLFAIKHLMFSIGLKVCSSKRKRRSKITKFSIKIT